MFGRLQSTKEELEEVEEDLKLGHSRRVDSWNGAEIYMWEWEGLQAVLRIPHTQLKRTNTHAHTRTRVYAKEFFLT